MKPPKRLRKGRRGKRKPATPVEPERNPDDTAEEAS